MAHAQLVERSASIAPKLGARLMPQKEVREKLKLEKGAPGEAPSLS